jgi:hypothetical protein
MTEIKAVYRLFLKEHDARDESFTLDDSVELVESLVARLKRIQTRTDNYGSFRVIRGWRGDASRGTKVMLIREHVWLLWENSVVWDPAIELMSDFDSSIFVSTRYKTVEEAVKKGGLSNRRMYVDTGIELLDADTVV